MVFPGMDLFFHSGDSSFIGSGEYRSVTAACHLGGGVPLSPGRVDSVPLL